MAGPDLTDRRDASAYLVRDGEELALIDTGAGPSYRQIVDNIRSCGCDPSNLRYVIATHAHIDHIGALADFAGDFPCRIIAHQLDAPAIESADQRFTAAHWYGLDLKPVTVQQKIIQDRETLVLGDTRLVCMHIPGHTPGSMVVYLDRDDRRYLFGQDIHGPFHKDFQSDRLAWRDSMHRVIELEADVLAEGHYGIIEGRMEVVEFIRGHLAGYGF